MTPLPRAQLEFQDAQLGLTPTDAAPHAKLGVAQAGPAVPQTLTRASQVAALYQGGPLAGALAIALGEASPVIGVRVPVTTASTFSEIDKTGAGPELQLGGTPNDAYDVSIRVTRPGTLAAGTAAVVITVGGTDQAERAVPVSGMLDIPGTGITATFQAGAALAAGGTYTFSSSLPSASVAGISDALTNLLAARPALRFVHILGVATPTLAAAVDAILQERETRGHYVHALLEARPRSGGWVYGDGTTFGDGSVWGGGETMAAYKAAMDAQFANVVSDRVAVALDGGLMYNPLTRTLEHRNSAWLLTGRRARQPIGEAAYRVRTGPLAGVSALVFDANLTGDAGRFAALRTFDQRTGVYPAQWPMLAASGSDYDAVQRREVIDAAAAVALDAATDYLGEDVLVDRTTGRIAETEALAFEAFVEGRVRARLGSNASGVTVRADRTLNILATEQFEFDLAVTPLGYFRSIHARVGFANPYLTQVAAAPTVAPTTPAP